MTTTHTPGPWKVEPLNADRVVIRKPDGGVAANCPAHFPADAALIAAAPELLEALYAALPLVEDAAVFLKDDFKPGYLAGIVRAMKSAIAKAEGR